MNKYLENCFIPQHVSHDDNGNLRSQDDFFKSVHNHHSLCAREAIKKVLTEYHDQGLLNKDSFQKFHDVLRDSKGNAFSHSSPMVVLFEVCGDFI